MNRARSFGITLILCAATAVWLIGCGGSGSSTGTGTGVTHPPNPLSPAEFVYVVNNQDNTVSQFQVNKDGSLSALSTPTVRTGVGPSFVQAGLTGRFLYVSNSTDGTISQFQVAANGVLQPLSPAAVSAGGSAEPSIGPMAIAAGGQILYALNTSDQTLHRFRIGSNGALTAQGVVSGVPAADLLAAHPTLSVLYVGNTTDNTLSQFKINADGSLTPLSPATATVPAGPDFLTVSPDGKFAYLGFEGSSKPAQYKVNADGTLTVLDLANTGIAADASGSAAPNIDPESRFVYTLTLGASGVDLLQFKIQADGTLAALTPTATDLGLTEIAYLAFDPSGQFVYAPGPLSNSLLGFRISSDGSLVALPVPAVATGSVPIMAGSVTRKAHTRNAASGHGAGSFIIVRQRS